MEDDSLDSLITNNPAATSASVPQNDAGNNVSDAVPAFRPKLRKIKRPKIRPMSDIPAAPAKIMPQAAILSENTVGNISVSPAAGYTGTEFPASGTNGAPHLPTETETKITPNSNAKEQTESSADNAPARESSASTDIESRSEVSGVLENDLHEELKQSTEIIKAVDAQNLTAGAEYDSSYILDGLPPELDYGVDEDIEDTYADNGSYVKKKLLFIASGLCLIIGLFTGKAMFSSQKVENYGLEGVVTNPDVPSGRPRCGLTDKSQACVFYLMNWYKQELNGRDFYKLAAQLTGREEYMIETDNLHYATVKIKPGHFAQLNIPALK